ncbi:glycosyltransferase family 61 protein [Atlantibacter hermannii]|uniref:glycosyltransferase family 61 protein n=1 Tax=Atlantibacter hermannii TaxID=565 RepID=UPI0028A1C4D0|nr:glycosyltransferase family 61 protein [Atlantibacter hermannii]MDW4577812.1 glycosyltransferase family 61 protein [Atlantibacter hermannii]
MLSLDSFGIEQNISQSSLKNDYLGFYESEISNRFGNLFKILIITNEKAIETGKVFFERYPDAEIHIASYGNSNKSNFSVGSTHFHSFFDINDFCNNHTFNKFNVVIEHGNNRKSEKIKIFKNLFLSLAKGGVYFIEELHAKFIPSLVDCDGEDILDIINSISQLKIAPPSVKSKSEPFKRSVSECCGELIIKGKVAMISLEKETLLAIRTNQALAMLESGALNGEVIFKDDYSYELESKISTSVNLKKNLSRHPKKTNIPGSFLACYKNINCIPGQVAFSDNVLLPDSFRIQNHKNLSNRNLQPLVNNLFNLKSENHKYIKKNGAFLYLDSEFPCHFGHFTSEVISRLWAWELIKKESSDAKVLIGVEKGKGIPSFIIKILSYYGINESEIATFDDGIIVEKLYCATPYYIIGDNINPDIKKIWDKIGYGERNGKSGIKGKKLFISRPVNGRRNCLNHERLENIFLSNGFELYNPENHPWEDQVKTFSSARIVAGYAGSGTFNAMFANGIKKMFIIGSDSYTANNEFYICNIKGIDLVYFWGDSLMTHDKGWSPQAFISDYNFNYARDEEMLLKELRQI